MNTCATCKHWEAPEVGYEYGSCGIIEDASRELSAFTCKGEPLFTRPEFGCTLWESK